MTKQEAFDEINRTQDEYIDELISLMNCPEYETMKAINFTSPTGTGKTKMMAKLINKLSDYYFIITTLSKGQLHLQVRKNLLKDCRKENFTVYGSADYKINSRLDAEDIIGKIPQDTKCIWLRDEGHIKTNRYDELLLNVCYKVINFSATNTHSDIQCNFSHTMMLRTVNQTEGTPIDAIKKLLEVKKQHKKVKGYNPCAIFRCVSGDTWLYDNIINLCKKYNLKYIDITEDDYVMTELCKDDNEYDVIINKFKIVEGIDIRRAHILYMDNQPNNNATTIQAIGRCRRNALLYRNDIDIFTSENEELLKITRECYVYYNVEQMKIETDINGELYYAFCNHISCEDLRPNTTISVINGQMTNGLYVIELEKETGNFKVDIDKDTGFNSVSPATDFYAFKKENYNNYVYTSDYDENKHKFVHYKIHICNIIQLPISTKNKVFDYYSGKYEEIECTPYYSLSYFSYANDYQNLFELVTTEEEYLIKHGFFNTKSEIKVSELKQIKVYNYEKIINDKESAIIGTDLMKPIRTTSEISWVESKSVSDKVSCYNKLNSFITKHYSKELKQAKHQYIKGKNDFRLDSKCNSIIGYCVEYYSKYLVYGNDFLEKYINIAWSEHRSRLQAIDKTTSLNDFIIIRACMLKYKEMMIKSFGSGVSKIIRSISTEQLVQKKYKEFCNYVIELGTKTANYVKKTLYLGCEPKDDIDPNLSIRHISGLADYITRDTILDVKVRNNIDENCVRQVLAYHYLSTKRSDLDIKRVIVYDAVSGKAVVINIGIDEIVI